jgi:hypothetical protein
MSTHEMKKATGRIIIRETVIKLDTVLMISPEKSTD